MPLCGCPPPAQPPSAFSSHHAILGDPFSPDTPSLVLFTYPAQHGASPAARPASGRSRPQNAAESRPHAHCPGAAGTFEGSPEPEGGRNTDTGSLQPPHTPPNGVPAIGARTPGFSPSSRRGVGSSGLGQGAEDQDSWVPVPAREGSAVQCSERGGRNRDSCGEGASSPSDTRTGSSCPSQRPHPSTRSATARRGG